MYYLIDGAVRRSLKTRKKGMATYLLEQYIRGKLGFARPVTVRDYYEEWIKIKTGAMVRPSTTLDYRTHFSCHLLPAFGSLALGALGVADLVKFRQRLLAKGLSVKTCRNIIDASFRAMWRDALIEGKVKENPFALLRWPRAKRHRPTPFKPEERDRIIQWWAENNPYFYPWIYFQFFTGMRPSESAGLTWNDIDWEANTITIVKSHITGEVGDDDGETKTENSNRVIEMEDGVRRVLEMLPSRDLGLPVVFLGKRGDAMSKKWAEHNWRRPLELLGIPHRKFYCTRHTFITEAVKRGENLMAIAGHCGTSVTMIERDYCARQSISIDRTKLAQQPAKYPENMVAGPGFEPIKGSISSRLQQLSARKYEEWKKSKVS
jgi:integrase